MARPAGGYIGNLLRVDLTSRRTDKEELGNTTLRKYIGGVGLGTQNLDEVAPGVEWSSAANPLMFFSGPLAGTRIDGSGTIAVVTKGALTNLAASTQANGFFGAFLKFSGFDGVIIKGIADRWSYLYIHGGTAELRDANHLLGKDTWETEQALKKEVGERCSVLAIGPAGENLVKFAAVVCDRGHVAGHNGVGAVMGSKKLKAIVAVRGKKRVTVRNPEQFKRAAEALYVNARDEGTGGLGLFTKWGTSFSFSGMEARGVLPVKNYTTNIFPQHASFTGQYLRTHFETKPSPCWACRIGHCRILKVTEGPYKGFEGEDPEYEGNAAFSSVIGQTDPGAMVMLSNLVDWLGMDCNESGWLIGWVMECYEKGLLSKNTLDGLEMTWGNAEATATLLRKIASRQGIGDLLAEGVKRAAEHTGGEAVNCAIYTLKGASPRGHDHRTNWSELIDTCFSNTGTIEAIGGVAQPDQLGLSPVKNPFDPIEVSTMNAKLNGRRQFEDTLGVCRFCMHSFPLILDTLNALTGWDFDIQEAIQVGRRIINQLRIFNFRHGLTKEMETPSTRYSSTPVDGPTKGISITPHWELIRRNYYEQMGWDRDTGRPLPATLKDLGLAHLIPQV